MLGVIGLIIGGIWIAAAAVSRENSFRRDAELTIRIVDQVTNLFKNQTFSGAISATQASAMGLVPPEVIRSGSMISYTNATLNIPMNTTSGQMTIGFNWGTLTSKSNCLELASMLAASPQLIQFGFYNQSWSIVYATPPMSFSTISGALASSTGCPMMMATFSLQ